MNDKFEIGEIALVIDDGRWQSLRDVLVGREVRIESVEQTGRSPNGKQGYLILGEPWYSISCDGVRYAIVKSVLRKRKPPLDAECYRVTSWDCGAWRPLETVHTNAD